MQKSILTEIIASLNKKEIRDINKFLQSPSHNQREDVRNLFTFLVKGHLQQTDLDKEKAWKAIFPDKPYDDAYMRQVMYFLLKAIEEFLVFAHLSNDPVDFQLILCKIFRNRRLSKAYRQAHRLGEEYLEKQALRNSYYLRNRYYFELEEYEYLMSITQNAPVNLQETADALNKWFIAEKLQISTAMTAHRRVYQKAHYRFDLLEESLRHVANHPDLLQTEAIAPYYNAWQALSQPEGDHYFDDFERIVLEEGETRFPADELRSLYQAGLNFCVAKVNKGFTEYSKRALRIYQRGLENGTLRPLNRYLFGNAVAFALKSRDFSFAEDFVKRYQTYLTDEKERESIVNFNLSRIYFEKGDYARAQVLLRSFEYDDMLLNIIAKTMLLKIYYEEDEYDAFESLLDSLRIYLKRKEALDPERKAAYKNTVGMMRRLLHLRPYSKSQRERLRKQVETTNPLMEREWLLRQLS
ncbi:MAG: hypothetical protein ACK4NS_02160 [Saprospiraceae bacterium]